jgi:hypothetical protein
MEILRDHPEIDAFSDDELRALEAFMGFCADHRLGDPGGSDIQAFVRLRDQTPNVLEALGRALHRLGIGRELRDEVEAVEAVQVHRATFDGVTREPTRAYSRQVSLPVEELPAAWQKTLRRLDIEGEYSPSIRKRMRERLGMFAWSAERAGHPADLADTAALRALYEDMRARSIARQHATAKKQGLVSDADTPRWAYLRSTWEELRRFAAAHGLPDAVRDKLGVTYSVLVKREERQAAEKIAKARAAGPLQELLKTAEAMLEEANSLPLPQMRHAMRNRAAAIALGCAVPARPGDVLAKHILGIGITHEPARNGYRFRYTARKTAGSTSADIDIPLQPWWNKFIDALILQDDDPRYLGQMRAKVFSEQRPLYVHYDGTPAAYPWYSRMWSIVAGTGGHIARTLVYDHEILSGSGAEGVAYGRAVNGHAPTSDVVRKYESERLAVARIQHGQNTMAALAAAEGDDL